MSDTLKIVIPMAGLGTRLRPHTWSKPKQLVEIAGRPLIDHVLAMMDSLPRTLPREYVFITGYLGDQVQAHMDTFHPDLRVHYAEQRQMLGQSHALYQARTHLHGPMLMVFADTLVETNLAFLGDEPAEAVAWVREAPDPRRFGVAEADAAGWVRRLIEKPQTLDNRQVVVGFYYFPDSEQLVDAIEEQLVQDIQVRGEYYLADAVNILLGRGMRMRTQPVSVWLDAGTVESTLETNAYLLENGQANFNAPADVDGVKIIPPVFIAPTAQIEASIIGPHASIGAGCRVSGSRVHGSILEAGAQLEGCDLHGSMVGRNARLLGLRGTVSLGDDAQVVGE